MDHPKNFEVREKISGGAPTPEVENAHHRELSSSRLTDCADKGRHVEQALLIDQFVEDGSLAHVPFHSASKLRETQMVNTVHLARAARDSSQPAG